MSPKLLTNFITILKEMTEQDGVIYIGQDEFKEYLKPTSYNIEVLSRTKRFKDKDIIVTTALDLSGTPIKSLVPIKKIQGRLDISNTNVSSIEGIEVVGYTSYSNTPISRREEAERRAKIMRSIKERRESGEWGDLEDGYSAKANALFEYLKGRDDLQDRPKNLQEKIDELEDRKSQLEQMQAQLDANSEEYDRLEGQIAAVDVEIEELNDGKFGDVYDLIPEGKNYGLAAFQSQLPDSENEEYFLGPLNEVDRAFKDYWENYVDEVGVEGFNESVIEDNLDMDRLRSDIEDTYENDVRENPEAYLSESDKELSRSQKEEIQRLETEKDELEVRLTDLESEDDEITDRIEEIETEIDEIKDSPEGDFKEDAIEEKISDIVSDYVDNYKEYLSNTGSDISDYLDKDSLVQYLVNSEDYGQMSSYDGEYDTIRFNEREYYIFRHN